MVCCLWSAFLKNKILSVHKGRERTPVVPPRLEVSYPAVKQKISVVSNRDQEASFTLSGTAICGLYPYSAHNGSSRIWTTCFDSNYQTAFVPSQLGGPFDFCAFASLSELLLGSLVIALKCTRPRQRFMYDVGRYSMTEGGMCQGGNWHRPE